MRAPTVFSLFAILAIGVSATPTPIRPDTTDVSSSLSDLFSRDASIADNDGPALGIPQQRSHVYVRRPRAHP